MVVWSFFHNSQLRKCYIDIYYWRLFNTAKGYNILVFIHRGINIHMHIYCGCEGACVVAQMCGHMNICVCMHLELRGWIALVIHKHHPFLFSQTVSLTDETPIGWIPDQQASGICLIFASVRGLQVHAIMSGFYFKYGLGNWTQVLVFIRQVLHLIIIHLIKQAIFRSVQIYYNTAYFY